MSLGIDIIDNLLCFEAFFGILCSKEFLCQNFFWFSSFKQFSTLIFKSSSSSCKVPIISFFNWSVEFIFL